MADKKAESPNAPVARIQDPSIISGMLLSYKGCWALWQADAPDVQFRKGKGQTLTEETIGVHIPHL